jgi:lysozyme family protein
MASFDVAFGLMIRNEGGYVLHSVPGDRGGMTFAGIARSFHPGWVGWDVLDSAGAGDARLPALVASFYRDNFWLRVSGDDLADQSVANSVFDFAVNAGVRVAVRLAQAAAGVDADGVLGPVSVRALNSVLPDHFSVHFALAKIARYAAIVNRDRSQSTFLLGWINRALEVAA